MVSTVVCKYLLGKSRKIAPACALRRREYLHSTGRARPTLCIPILGPDYAMPLSRTCDLGSGYLGTGMFQSENSQYILCRLEGAKAFAEWSTYYKRVDSYGNCTFRYEIFKTVPCMRAWMQAVSHPIRVQCTEYSNSNIYNRYSGEEPPIQAL